MSSLQGILPSFKINRKRFSYGWFATLTLHELFNYLPRTSLISVGHLLDVHMYVFVILMRNKFNMLCRKHKFFATGETLLFLNYFYNYLRKYTQHNKKCINIRIPVTIPDLSVNRLVFSIEFFCFDYVLCFLFIYFVVVYFYVMFAFLFTFYCFFKK